MTRIQHIYRRRLPPQRVITQELARYMTELSSEINRQIGVIIDRRGNIEYVIVGDTKGLLLPDLKRVRVGKARFRGLRCIHTNLNGEGISRDDLTDLALLRLDLICSLHTLPDGLPGTIQQAHLLPENPQNQQWEILPPCPISQLDTDFLSFINSLEDEFAKTQGIRGVGDLRDRAILVSVTVGKISEAEDSLRELDELADSSGVVVLDKVLQHRKEINPKFVMGLGKLNDLVIRSLQLGADLLIFDQNLSPAQIRSISDVTELKVIDRTQLILDIFAQRAHSRDGKIQVELAQLKYLLPRLTARDTDMSRLTGGIGGRGPGETKLEIDRRRVRDRIHRLEKEIEQLGRGREQRRAKRARRAISVLSIVGYTNAGKSTLLNALTKSQVGVGDYLFATLDPTSKRLRFPKEREVIITDTVGFIRDLPKDLMAAFRATFEELQDADLLLHIVDVSNPQFLDQMKAVEKILTELNLDDIPKLLVFNKEDKVPSEIVKNLCQLHDAVSISAIDVNTLSKLLKRTQLTLWEDDEWEEEL
ncbi:MAG: GTPase HflX [Candidatus Tectomicrobia bacterium]|nr:GTPase HflX [Candidatus Tectomicrobia bacterium]